MVERLNYVSRILSLLNSEIGEEKAVLGFSGAPYTLACYMVEGQGRKLFVKIRRMMYHDPELYGKLMDKLTRAVITYLTMQIESGAAAVQLFDTWAGDLNREDYRHFVLPYMQQIISSLKTHDVPVIYYINGVGNLLDIVQETDADVLGIDWRISLADVRQRLGHDTVVQGNLDPTALFLPPENPAKK